MSTLGYILGALGLIAAAAAGVWYKYQAQATDLAASNSAASQADKTALAAEAQIQAKNEQERQELNDQITTVKAIPDAADRARAAMDLLSKYRAGLH